MQKTFRTGLSIGLAVAVAVIAAAWTYIRYDANTLRKVRARGELLCGVNTGLPGFSNPDAQGNWIGFDVDFCRAVAAAIFDDPKKVKFVPLDASERFRELRDRKVDVLSRNSTWNRSRELGFGLHFAAVSYYDGQGFMVRRAKNVDTALELDGSKICMQTGTTTQRNLADFFRTNNMKYQEVRFDKLEDVVKAYDSGQCDVVTSDVSQLYAQRLKLAKPGDHVILRRCDLEGAAGAGRAPQGRRLAAAGEMDVLCDAERRGARHHLEEHRRGDEVDQAGGHALRRHRGQLTARTCG